MSAGLQTATENRESRENTENIGTLSTADESHNSTVAEKSDIFLYFL